MELFIKLLAAGVAMGVLDAVWLTQVASKLYRSHLSELLLDKPNMIAAGAFYVIYVVGVVMLVVNPAVAKGSIAHALGYGALFGFVAYSTFALTNAAVLKGFSLKVILPDMIWGAVLTAAMSAASYWAVKVWLG